MPEQMDPIKAARLLERWISFYGMDDKDAWPQEDYPFVKQSCEAMLLAIELLRGKTANVDVGVKRAAAQLEKWPKVHSMDDPEYWESEDFVRSKCPGSHPFCRIIHERTAGRPLILRSELCLKSSFWARTAKTTVSGMGAISAPSLNLHATIPVAATMFSTNTAVSGE
jgi:hypothetical protein